jgi:hypothetical protein
VNKMNTQPAAGSPAVPTFINMATPSKPALFHWKKPKTGEADKIQSANKAMGFY